MPRCDVLVVGAGLAGLWTARRLAGAGLHVVLVDGRARVDQQIRTTGIFVRRTLEDFDLPEDCFGPVVQRVVLYSPGRRSQVLDSPHPEFRVGRMGPLYRRLLDEARAAGVEWRPRTRCTGIGAGDEPVVKLTGKGSSTLSPRFIIGADGARSRVAGWLGLDQNREWIAGVEEVYTGVPLEGPAVFHCLLSTELAPGYLAWMVHDGEEVHLGVGGHPDRFDPARALERLKAEPPVPVDWGRAKLVDRRGGLIPVGGVLPRIANRRGLLVGDAAGAVSPLTAGGLDPCVRLSDLAARVTVDLLESGDPSALAPYEGGSFRRRFASRLMLRRLLSGLERPWLLEGATALLRLPPFERVARKVFFGRGSFPDVPGWIPGRRITRSAVA
ncbi:MAG TPA: NAD(P)/FAD-dependent oxidoreductase [Gemmatimonadales bacterium]|nr:NAD(P)/FAD-dependent oxidoreductase [Gemmatimonadales bacterium]